MRSVKGSALVLGGLALVIAFAVQFLPAKKTAASDHIDSPIVAQDRGADLADLYAFLDPNDNSRVVLIMSTQGFIVSGEHFGMGIFDPHIRYRFEIENTGDAKPDKFLDVTYSPGVGRLTSQTATIALPNGHTFTAPTTIVTQNYSPNPPVITTDPATGARFFAGVMDDPFFLDDTGANRFVASSLMHPGHPDKSLLGMRRGRDTYAGFNTMITAVSVPASMLRGKGNVIGINAVTQRRQTEMHGEKNEILGSGGIQTIDRDGNPLINNGLIPAARKDEYNASETEDDAEGKFRADIIKDLRNFGTDDAHIAMILKLAVTNGDILRLDLGVPNRGAGGGANPDGGFGKMGGRRLRDDVVDLTFTVINNGVPLTDYVNANEKPFRDVFPFVADPTQPFPPGHEDDDHTRQ
ncbi:MAG: DUF4331 family protein [Candidatus Eremiobacteraeota bacterium]|nr:DUF4331 family protein [Candidatus Eremiobacteraeota bacterium]MBC5827462.1 DUF4331 family protein [Candidatus Eremiobacteraeota bacterium]